MAYNKDRAKDIVFVPPKEDGVFNVTIWFTNGESRVFGATKTYRDDTGIGIKSSVNGSVIYFNGGIVAGVWDESREWQSQWG